jgi:hypothetical protein
MDFDVQRAIEYILSGELAESKKVAAPRGLLRHFTRSKSKVDRSPSRNSSTVGMEDDEDEQLRLAVAMSLAQESGTESVPRSSRPSGEAQRSNSPYFGPARRTDYTESQWGMVLSSPGEEQETGVVDRQGNYTWSSTPQVELEKIEPATERIRREDLPVVLDPRRNTTTWGSEEVSWMASLFSILHKIPIAREAFILSAPRDGEDQTPDDRWWDGTRTHDDDSTDVDDTTGLALLRETARIMAFLDDTDRAYGKYLPFLVS